MVQWKSPQSVATLPTGTPATIRALTGVRALAAGWVVGWVVLEHFRGPLFDLAPGLRSSPRW